MANAITKFLTFWRGQEVGKDRWGNHYYQDRRSANDGQRRRRWVVYANNLAARACKDDPSQIPPAYYNWLHYTSDEFPIKDNLDYDWMEDREPNATGSAKAWHPQGHALGQGVRPKATGDYQAWSP